MMLFNIKQCRWRSVARQEFEQRSESLLGAADRRRAAGVRTHIENNVFEFERHGAARRGAALHIQCATPFTLLYFKFFYLICILF